ncbi:MAG: proprotein convertase P-domain protein, partial [Acidobacteriota bacterium]
MLRQRFLNANQAPPSPALTKAVLMNTARYLNGAGAADSLWSNAQGMGEVNLTTALDIFTTPTVLRDQVGADILTATGQTRIVTGTVANSGKPFRVTLAWTDAPGSTTGNAYVNDLNLEVTVGGQTYRGNVFAGAVSAAGGEFDSRNNVESVFIPAGVSGPFVVKITGANIAGDGVMNVGSALDQDFALVVSNATESAQPALTSIGSLLTGESCSPANNVIDPGETVTVSLGLQNLGTANTANLVATLQASGGVGNPGAAQNYGVVQAGGPSVFRSFTFVAGGICGGTLTATLSLQDGATNLGTVSFNFTLGTSTASTVTVTNNAAITIPAGPVGTTSGQASPYPSNLAVSGLTGAISKVTVTLLNASHTEPNDLDLLLVGPDGKKVLLMSDAGGTATMSNATLTFDDSALAVSETGPLTTGTYAPANYGGVADSFPSPAPAGPYADPPRLSAFNGMSPNGTWALYVVDDSD